MLIRICYINVIEFFLAKHESTGGDASLGFPEPQFEGIAQESDRGLSLLAEVVGP